MSLRFLEEASDELLTALRGYSENDVRVAADFASAIALLIGNLGGERVVVAVAHERRRPGYWRERLP